MDQDAGPSRMAIPWYAAGAVLVVAAVALYMIDSDPAFLFQSPLASFVIAAAGVAVAYLGYQRSKASSHDE
ncbi:MAG: hypothetical protein ACYDCK_02535 [Thermoplasmatota archaeon]